MNFCPICANLLLISKESEGYRLRCRTCSYYYPLYQQIKTIKDIVSKKQAEIVTAQKDLPVTQITCPKCSHDKAYYEMMQTRSADEASTIFYKCTECGHTWNSDR